MSDEPTSFEELPLSDVELDNLQERLKAVTPGPWRLENPTGCVVELHGDCEKRDDCVLCDWDLRGRSDPLGGCDAAFITAARELVPRLIATVRALEGSTRTATKTATTGTPPVA